MAHSLVVQWLELSAFTAEGLGSIPGRGTKIPQATRQGQNKQTEKPFLAQGPYKNRWRWRIWPISHATPWTGQSRGPSTTDFPRCSDSQSTFSTCRYFSSSKNDPPSGHISGENSNSKRYMHPYVHSSTIHNS